MMQVLAILLWSCSVLPFLMVGNMLVPFFIQLAVVVALCVVAWTRRSPRRSEVIAFSLAWLVPTILWIGWGARLGAFIAQLVATGLAAYVVFFSRSARVKKRTTQFRIGSVVIVLACIGIEIVACLAIASFLDSDVLASQWMGENKRGAEQREEVLPDGSVCYRNVSYAAEFPNSYLDIYPASESEGVTPTLIYVDGGTYVRNRTMIDPSAEIVDANYDAVLSAYAKAGYNVVTVHYAYAPVYRYPTPVIQMSQAVSYLKKNAATWNLDMTDVVIAGASAGGNIAGQYVLSQCDADYRKQLRLPRDFEEGEIRAVGFNCAIFDNARANQTSNPILNYEYDTSIRSYFFITAVDGGDYIAQTNLILHAAQGLPPAYIDDGGSGGFADQARDMKARLDELGIESELCIYDASYSGFDMGDSWECWDNLSRQIAFFDTYAK